MDGNVEMLSQTGPFAIPVQCRTKRCQVELQHSQVDFDQVFIGETAKRHVTIHNAGALPTLYTVTLTPRDTPRGTTVDTSGALLGGSSDLGASKPLEPEEKSLVKGDPVVMSGLGVYDGQQEREEGTVQSMAHSSRKKLTTNASVSFATLTHEQGEGGGVIITAGRGECGEAGGHSLGCNMITYITYSEEIIIGLSWMQPSQEQHNHCHNINTNHPWVPPPPLLYSDVHQGLL